jgi:hypothetical protein
MALVPMAQALEALGIEGWSLHGEPTTEAEFNAAFIRITGYDSEDMAIESTDPNDFGVTWSQISAKMTELENAEPMRVLRAERDRRIAETDWWALPDRTMTTAQSNYRQALRDITTQTPSLDANTGELTGITWPTKP